MTMFTWRCETCGEPIEGDSGYIGASFEEIRRGGPVTWHAYHDACLKDDDAYSVDAVRASDQDAIRWWTEHLARKNWYLRSNWRDVVLDQTGLVIPDEWEAHAERQRPGSKNAAGFRSVPS